MKIWNTRPLQKFGFRDSPYERPSQKWVCGHARQGKPCRQGPGADGRCNTKAECTPVKKNDRWICSRSQGEGGECANGPLEDGSCCRPIISCQPRRSIRSARGALTKWVTVLVVGLLTVILTAPYGAELFSPGPLSASHTELKQCAACHDDALGSPVQWAARIFAPPTPADGSAGCIKCHTMGKEAPLLAHGILPAKAKDTSEAQLAANPLFLTASKTAFNGPFEPRQEIACATCHQEHGGAEAHIKTMSDSQCQTCHTVMFKGFTDGHPKFTEYPYSRRTRIVFDHESHFKRHFPESKKSEFPTECQDCHESGGQGQIMTVKSFETSCSICHLDEVTGRGSGPRTIAFLSLPGFDLESLQDAEVNIGAWPEYAEEPLAPFMKLMLSADDTLKQDIELLDEEDIDLMDLADAEPEILESVERIAWGIKSLMYELTLNGPSIIIKNLSINDEVNEETASDLISALPFDVVKTTTLRWFPNLVEEIEQHRNGDILPTVIPSDDDESEAETEEAEIDPDLKSWMQYGGWQGLDFDLMYRPTKHGDAFMKIWISTTASASAGPLGELARPLFDFLADKKGTGKCAKCHSVDEDTDGNLAINWTARKSIGKFRNMTDFSHDKHNAILQKSSCKTCHTFAKNTKYLESFKDLDATTFASNFVPLEKEICTECHIDNSALGTCTTCHNYHFGEVSLVETRSSIKEK